MIIRPERITSYPSESCVRVHPVIEDVPVIPYPGAARVAGFSELKVIRTILGP
jgi:hypothetical protein